ncbi:uncharacterized protein LOC119009127 [Acanthopagrus latus]|uniref:uncharacterized protein LOC119009127 n=1 Tax=Acanthopagrus latus TaxID=8177 RepID=UPI00187CD0CF|nr:uncharacterized protein LOC119009127 [Acanthopagrus latus]
MEQTEGASPPPPPPPPLPAQHHADCGEKSDDTPETEKEELTKDGEESLRKNQGGQTSVSEKQMTADEKCSEEGVQDELPRQEAIECHRGKSLANLRSSSEHSWAGLLPPSLKHQKRLHTVLQESTTIEKLKGQAPHNILPHPGPLDVSPFSLPTSNWNNIQNPYISPSKMAHARYFASPHLDRRTREQIIVSILRERKKTAAYLTPGHSQDKTRGAASPGKPLLGTSSRGCLLSGSSSTQIHSDPQKHECSAKGEMVPPVTAENYLTENPELQQHSPSFRGGTLDHYCLSYNRSSLGPSPYIPSHSSSFDSTDELIFRNSKKTYPTAVDPTPGRIPDDARGTELPATDPLIFQSLQGNRDSDSAACYDREKGVQLSGSTVGGHDNLQKKEVTRGMVFLLLHKYIRTTLLSNNPELWKNQKDKCLTIYFLTQAP